MSKARYYYIDKPNKIIKHYSEALDSSEDGFSFAGMSELTPKSAAGYYANNERGYSIIDGDQTA